VQLWVEGFQSDANEFKQEVDSFQQFLAERKKLQAE
jgi:hypothetical protein